MRGLPVAGLRACSACAGDYEDPERSTPIEAADEEHAAEDDQRIAEASAEAVRRSIPRDEFPAQ